MAKASENDAGITSLKSMVVSGICVLAGLAGLAGLDYWAHKLPKEPWWFLVAHHAFAIVSATGFVGILFELTLRRRLVEETIARLKTLFNEDPEFARALSPSARENWVENSLKAHLGEELGQAIFLGLVHRYFVQPKRYRKNAKLIVSLSAPQELKVNSMMSAQTGLDPKKYCNLTADYSFRSKLISSGTISVICTLSDDIGDLYEIFRRPDCLAREVITLDASDRQAILEMVKNSSRDRWTTIIQSIAHADVYMNDVKLPLISVSFLEQTLSVIFEFKCEACGERSDRDHYQVIIKSIFLRSYGLFPIVIAEPTYNPSFELWYSDPSIAKVSAAPFLTSESPFEPRIMNDPDMRRIVVTATNSIGESGWVFPSSGVIFTWQSTNLA